MIRNNRRYSFPVLRAGLLLGVLLCLAFAEGPVFAGEEEGINGYSMRLKNKNFSSDDDSGSGSLIADTQSTPKSGGRPQMLGEIQRQPTWFLLGRTSVRYWLLILSK